MRRLRLVNWALALGLVGLIVAVTAMVLWPDDVRESEQVTVEHASSESRPVDPLPYLPEDAVPAERPLATAPEPVADAELAPIPEEHSEARLRAVVLSGFERVGVSGVEVTLGPRSPAPTGRTGPRATPQAEPNARRLMSDSNGEVVFDDVPAGEWRLTARRGPELSVSLSLLVARGQDQEARLILPAAGWLVGRVLVPADASTDALFLRTEPLDPKGSRERLAWYRAHAPTKIDSDGTFRHGPLLPGEVQVLLAFPSTPDSLRNREWNGVSGPSMEVERAIIQAGEETECLLDLRGRFPGRIRIAGTLDGSPATHLGLSARQLTDDGNATRNQMVHRLDEAGRATLGPLPPGRWQLSFRPTDGSWVYSADIVEVRSNDDVTFEVAIDRFPGSVLVLDATTGAAATNAVVWLRMGSKNHQVRTDAYGHFDLNAPVGRYSVSLDALRSAGATLDWTPAGPAPTVLRLPRAAARRR